MRTRKPLEVVRIVRSKAVENASAALHESTVRAAAAKQAAAAAEAHLQNTRVAARKRTESESSALAGGATAADFAQLAAFEVGAKIAIDRASSEATASDKRAEAATSEEARAREGLVSARTALQTVERHQAHDRARRDREDEARADEVAEEAFAARRP